MNIFIRPAALDDGPVIASLLEAGFAELAPERGGATWRESEARALPLLPSVLADLAAKVHVVVAGIDGVILGVAITKTRPLHNGRYVAHIGELVVEAAARGVGIGNALLDEATEWARQIGAVGIESVALPGQRATKNFFEAAQMKARLLTVFRDLTANADASTSSTATATGDELDVGLR